MNMRRSKLRFYEDILYSLSDKEKTIDEIAFSTNMDCVALRSRIDFLLRKLLVKEKNNKKITLFALTSRGQAICRTITITKQFEKLQKNIKKMSDTLQTIHVFSRQELDKINFRE